jgi:peptidoglycan/xylan/chitin deacetylase (PgdA/CDA1 family)
VRPAVKWLGNFPDGREVALTFDAEHPSRSGNDPGAADAILTTLADAGVEATFFLQGRWVSAYPSIARRIVSDGHLVGNHSHYHARMSLLAPEGVLQDVAASERRIMDITGADPRPWFRCPFGDGADLPSVLESLTELGYRNVGWDIDPGDWSDGCSAADVRSAIIDAMRSRESGTVILFHLWSAATAAALPSVIEDLRTSSASFVTVAKAGR